MPGKKQHEEVFFLVHSLREGRIHRGCKGRTAGVTPVHGNRKLLAYMFGDQEGKESDWQVLIDISPLSFFFFGPGSSLRVSAYI